MKGVWHSQTRHWSSCERCSTGCARSLGAQCLRSALVQLLRSGSRLLGKTQVVAHWHVNCLEGSSSRNGTHAVALLQQQTYGDIMKRITQWLAMASVAGLCLSVGNGLFRSCFHPWIQVSCIRLPNMFGKPPMMDKLGRKSVQI